MHDEDTIPPEEREAARKSISLPIWMWKRIEAMQVQTGIKTEAEIIRQIGAVMFGAHRTIWDYLERLTFEKIADGSLRATTPDGFIIRIAPQTQGRWSSAAWHVADRQYNIPYPSWQHSMVAAQLAALAGLDQLRRETPEHYTKVVGTWLEKKKQGS